MKNILVKGTISGVRVYAAATTDIVQNLNKIHDLSPVAAAALGRAATGALLLASTMKDNERITLRFKGDGPLGEVIADAKGNTVRGYVDNPHAYLPPKNGKLDVGGGVGQGNIIVTRFLQNAEPFTGYCELKNGEIASDITNYLYVSEQTPASVALGVLVAIDGSVLQAGGYFVQAMPGVPDEVLKHLEDNIITMPTVTELMNAGFSPEGIIQNIGQGLEVAIKETIPLELKCTCNKEKVEAMLMALPDKDFNELAEDEVTEVHCHFCNTSYKYTSSDLKALRAEKKAKQS